MPQYSYSAKGMDGIAIKGVIEAENISRARQILKDKRLFIINVAEFKTSQVQAIKLKLKDVAMFCRQFYTLLNSGVTVIKSLDILYQQTDSKKLKNVILKIYESVQKGDMLSDAVKKQPKAFPDLMVNMLETGEASGTLDKVMNKMSTYMDREVKLKSKITGALIYPAVIAVVTVVVVAILIIFVMPSFVTMFTESGATVPGITLALLGASKFATKYWYILLLIIGGLILIIKSYISSEKGRMVWDKAKLELPIINKAVIKIYASRFSETMATLLAGGLPLLQSLEITSRVIGNKFIEGKLLEAREGVRKGMLLSASIRDIDALPPIVNSMISVGEESGALDSLLERTARYYDDEVEAAIAKLVGLIEPVMILVMAAIVGVIVISIALPMFDMVGTIQV